MILGAKIRPTKKRRFFPLKLTPKMTFLWGSHTKFCWPPAPSLQTKCEVFADIFLVAPPTKFLSEIPPDTTKESIHSHNVACCWLVLCIWILLRWSSSATVVSDYTPHYYWLVYWFQCISSIGSQFRHNTPSWYSIPSGNGFFQLWLLEKSNK